LAKRLKGIFAKTQHKMNYFSSDFKLGILGGGQLGKMLLFDTRKFDIQTYVLDPSDEAPSKIACNKFFQGDLMDYETVYNFGNKSMFLLLKSN
jgi:5-(carboxyamino)imidazole ribonucleotide synthase